jgi:DNA-binding MarR family transcriptional regulator
MNEKSVVEQARYIFRTGKLIHDRIMKIQSQYLASNESCPFGDLSIAQLYAIREIRDRGPLTMSELAEILEVSPPSASAMVDRLVEKGLLSREHSTKDRRKVLVRISPDSVKEIEALENNILQLFVQLVNQIGPETTQQWCTVLSCIKQQLVYDAKK